MAEKDIIAQYQRAGRISHEIAPDKECLRDPSRVRLHGVANPYSPLVAIAQELLEERLVLRCGDGENIGDPRQQQCRQRVVDHRLVVNRHELLADDMREGVEPGSRTARQDDPLACHRPASFP